MSIGTAALPRKSNPRVDQACPWAFRPADDAGLAMAKVRLAGLRPIAFSLGLW